MITTFDNIFVLKSYIIVLRPIFDTTHKGKKRVENTYDFLITNWSYSL